MTSAWDFVIISNVAARCLAAIAQSVEHVIGNDEVIGPNPISSSIKKTPPIGGVFFMALLMGTRSDMEGAAIVMRFYRHDMHLPASPLVTLPVTNPISSSITKSHPIGWLFVMVSVLQGRTDDKPPRQNKRGSKCSGGLFCRRGRQGLVNHVAEGDVGRSLGGLTPPFCLAKAASSRIRFHPIASPWGEAGRSLGGLTPPFCFAKAASSRIRFCPIGRLFCLRHNICQNLSHAVGG